MTAWLAFAAGVALMTAAWSAVARTTFLPGRYAGHRAALTVRMARTVLRSSAVLPGRGVAACVPAVLLVSASLLLLADGVGLLLTVPLLTGAPVGATLLRVLTVRGGTAPPVLVQAYLAAQALLTVLLAVYLVRFVRAYDRRETVHNRLLGRPGDPDDAEQALARYLGNGSRAHLEQVAGEAARWLADVRLTHQAQPLLLYARPRGPRAWPDGALALLDAAALVSALAPDWATPHTRDLLEEGAVCLPLLAALLGAVPPVPAVSLHGREEHDFECAVAVAAAAGVPVHRSTALARERFALRRSTYAPHIAAIQVAVRHQHRRRPGTAACVWEPHG